MKSNTRLRNYLVILLDGAVVFLCFYIVLLFGRDSAFYELMELRKVIYITVASTVLIFIFTDMYRDIFKRYIEIIFNCSLAGLTGIVLFYIFVNIRAYHSSTVTISYLLVMILLAAFLSAERILIEILYRAFMKTKNIAIVGGMEQSLQTGYEFIKNNEKTHKIKYIVTAENGIDGFVKILGDTNMVILCSGMARETKDKIVEICARNNKVVLLIPELYEINTMRPRLTQIDDTPYLYFDTTGLSGEEKLLKRTFDLLFSILLTAAALPVIAICAVIIKLDSTGPVFFRQIRVTRDGTFNMIKLRTMVVNAEEGTGAVISNANDGRITKFGRFLRSSRLDEVPQLLNVIMGDMSLIGPRPERPIFVNDFKVKYPDYDKRHSVKAGISGLAQIMGKYSTGAYDKLRYDLIYIRNYSMILDIKIFFLTLKTVFLDSGSVQDNISINYAEEMKKYNIEIID